MYCFQNISQIEENVEEKVRRYAELNLTFQPTMFMVEGEVRPSFYVVFNSIKYRLPSLLKCIDATFKIINVLNLQYAMESLPVWTLIQNLFYKIDTKYDVSSCALANLMREMAKETIVTN